MPGAEPIASVLKDKEFPDGNVNENQVDSG